MILFLLSRFRTQVCCYHSSKPLLWLAVYTWLYKFSGINESFPFDYGSADSISSHVILITQCTYIWRLLSEVWMFMSMSMHRDLYGTPVTGEVTDCTLHSSTEVRGSSACVERGCAYLHFWLRSASYFYILILSFIGVPNAQCWNFDFCQFWDGEE